MMFDGVCQWQSLLRFSGILKSMWAELIDDDAAGDGDLARGCEGSVKKKVVIKKGEG